MSKFPQIADEFPYGYGNIPYSVQQKILNWFNNSGATSMEKRIVIDFLSDMEIYVGYGWVGHRGEYFLATYDDALAQEEFNYTCD